MVKVISLSDEAYGKLKMIKRNMSFSEVIVDLVERKKKRNLIDFVGVWSKEEGAKIKKSVIENRKKQKMRSVEF
ncbi:MAG: antitoxin VapB family protein [Nanoarchaeota archaeon]